MQATKSCRDLVQIGASEAKLSNEIALFQLHMITQLQLPEYPSGPDSDSVNVSATSVPGESADPPLLLKSLSSARQ